MLGHAATSSKAHEHPLTLHTLNVRQPLDDCCFSPCTWQSLMCCFIYSAGRLPSDSSYPHEFRMFLLPTSPYHSRVPVSMLRWWSPTPNPSIASAMLRYHTSSIERFHPRHHIISKAPCSISSFRILLQSFRPQQTRNYNSRCDDCYDCRNCSNCDDCYGCSNCSNCDDCNECTRCDGCGDCMNCTGCSRCDDCNNCTNCGGCTDCTACAACTNCADCTDCQECVDCADCTNCTNCTDCTDCQECVDCADCTDCTNCTDCVDCVGLTDAVGKRGVNKGN